MTAAAIATLFDAVPVEAEETELAEVEEILKPDAAPDETEAAKQARREEYAAKRTARPERFEERAANAAARSEQAMQRSISATEGIPFGQPILVGHHSEGRHRAAIKRSHQAADKSLQESKKAEYWADRAASAASNNAIMSDDPDASEKLADKIARLEKRQALMTAANKCARKNDRAGLLDLGFSETQADELLSEPEYSFQKKGFQSWQLSNNNANINRLKKRVAQLEKLTSDETTEREENGVRVVENVEENRVQLFFPGIPAQEVRDYLKRHGFKWARSVGAWQRHRSSAATYYANEALKLIAATE